MPRPANGPAVTGALIERARDQRDRGDPGLAEMVEQLGGFRLYDLVCEVLDIWAGDPDAPSQPGEAGQEAVHGR